MGYFTKGRVETFSDGIFAIIVTLLVLEIKVPHIADHDSVALLSAALWNLLPKVVAWMISFLTVCVIWVNHHRIFEAVRTIDQPFFWLNANLLLWVSLIPFPTALMGDYPHNPLAVSVYGAVSFMMGIAFLLIRWYMLKRVEITQGVSNAELRRGLRNVLFFGPTPYLVAIGVAWIHPYLAFAIYAFVTIYFIFPRSTALGKDPGPLSE
ncbi:MAG: DUF1211 domain-containing protein [Acidobacteria bacterium]|nr:DUF1211 domain-containing protein [Acidobacteriota bacterium]